MATMQKLKAEQEAAGKAASKIKDDTRNAVDFHRNQQYIPVGRFLHLVRIQLSKSSHTHEQLNGPSIIAIIDGMIHEQEKQTDDSVDGSGNYPLRKEA